jgi:hypothetical protein
MRKAGEGWIRLLLLIPMFCIWVPFYNSVEPTLFGFPFFYWFQLAWIFVSMIITAAVYYWPQPQ